MATATIQEANKEGKALQLLSFDIEKAFDKTGHQVIIQALRAFGIPENTVQAIKRMALFGYAYVEVNGKKGILIMIKTGSGQGDPISSILFLMATEPLNRALIKKHENIFYRMNQNTCFGAFFYADDNLVPVKITNIQDIINIQNTYNEYREVSGLNVNMKKSTALCINTAQELIRELNQLGIQTPEQMRYLGVQLAKTMQLTVQKTMEHIEPKTIKRRILATTPPTDLLHRCTLINRALVPIYNHVFMTLPMSMENANEISTEIYSFLWTKQEAGITKQKRRLVAKDRISAGCEMGGLSVNTPAQMMDGMQQNLIQKIYRKIDTTQETIYMAYVKLLLNQINRPTLDEHVGRYFTLESKSRVKTGIKNSKTGPNYYTINSCSYGARATQTCSRQARRCKRLCVIIWKYNQANITIEFYSLNQYTDG
jgi:hypothetical protein